MPSLVCPNCTRANPAEAAYCYYDGAALAGRGAGPVNAGSAPFPSPFVFPNGTSCRNFDQLASACQQDWSGAVDLLKKGFLGGFFGSMGRVDLAMAAQEAANFPDADRGLDQLLAKLPTQTLQPPKLQAEPREINLGVLPVGTDRRTELHLTNLGMRLLYGTAASDCKWLTLGEAPGAPEKLFQFGSDTLIPIQVVGKHLRAGAKPIEGHLVVESNGGTTTVTVKAEVPITPFPSGLFAGAITPRQVAEKARANPKDAIPQFETGAVASWYASNGWNYPVHGPTMYGAAVVQQFFEALGVAKPPKVELATPGLSMAGAVGQALQATIEITSQERKPVYAWATCDQPWVEFGKSRLSGKSATVPLTVRVPPGRGQLVEATVQVVGNGNQKFTVPLRLSVTGGAHEPSAAAAPEVLAVVSDDDFAFTSSPPPLPDGGPPPLPGGGAFTPPPLPGGDDAVVAVTAPPRRRTGSRAWMHLLPLGVLALALLLVLVHDIFFTTQGGGGGGIQGVDPGLRYLDVNFDYNFGGKSKATFTDRMGFGVVGLNPQEKSETKKLTYGEYGHTNSTILLIDGRDKVFGSRFGGKFFKPPHEFGTYGGKACTYQLNNESIFITQEVTIQPGEPVPTAKGDVRPLDTCLVKYKIENRDKQPHQVGLRLLLDTYIVDNDGVPFTLPGEDKLVDTEKDFKTPREVPGFIQVLQRPDLKNPGLVAQLNLRISDKIEPPGRVSLTHWPGPDKKDRWDVPMAKIGDDSAVVLYWEPRELRPGQSRDIGFTYGLGHVEIGPQFLLGVTVGGQYYVGGELTVVALVADPKVKSVKLELPKGLQLLDTPAQQPVTMRAGIGEAARPSPVTWRVRAIQSGTFTLDVSTDTGMKQSRRVKIEAKSIF